MPRMTTANPTAEAADTSAERLAALSTGELWRLLVRHEDRVPRALIDACASRGEESLDEIGRLIAADYLWEDDVGPGEFWLPLHAAMILGLMSGERTGALLLSLMERVDAGETENLQDWLTDAWPVLFRNKRGVQPALRALAENRDSGSPLRADAIAVALALAETEEPAALDDVLAFAAGVAFDPAEDEAVRIMIGARLLAYARPEHRKGLEQLARLQEKYEVTAFAREDVLSAYASGGAPRVREADPDPWRFYDPEEIAARQARWAEDARARERVVWDAPGETYVRENPKIGRNDLCPCGSGRKYKKCCMVQGA